MHDLETCIILIGTLSVIMLPILFVAGIIVVTIVKAVRGDFKDAIHFDKKVPTKDL